MQKNYFSKGFGIVEVLIASSIIIMIVFALVAAGRSALRSAIYMHERAQATYIAAGGIEVLRQIRDSNWIDQYSQTSWSSFELVPISTTPMREAKDYSSSGVSYGRLRFNNSSTKRFYLDNISTTPLSGASSEVIQVEGMDFKRTVTIAKINPSSPLLPNDLAGENNISKDINAIKVTSTVTWQGNLNQQEQLSISEILTNWRPNY